MSASNTFKTTHVRHDPDLCLAPGLFQSVPKGRREEMFTDVTYETAEATLHFEGRHILGPTELRVLQGLIAMAPICGANSSYPIVIDQEPTSKAGLAHLKSLETPDAEIGLEARPLVVRSTFYELAKEIGYSETSFDSGRQAKDLRTSLERLWTVTVLVIHKDGDKREGYHILSRYQSAKDGKFTVAINPRMAASVLGRHRYTRIDMAEIRTLRTDPTRLIHQRLCGWIDPGRDGRIQLDTLCGYVWPKQALSLSAIKKRKGTAKKALKELEGLGWTVEEYAKEKYRIERRGLAN
jgi:hypothetical protein